MPDFFVEEVRLEAAAARLGADLELLRDLDAELRDEDFTAPRLELREAVFLAEERDAPERADEDLREADELDLAEAFLAVVFLAVVFLAAVFLAVVFLAADLAEDFAEVFFAVVFLAAVFFAVDFLAPDLAEDFEADFEVDFAAVFLAVVFLAPELFEPDFLVLDEPLRELLFFVDFLVLVAPVSPVNSIVSGFLVSVGIAASFKGLRVQPSRLQGNVVIPRRFRITESVDSRTRTFSVDMLLNDALFTCRCKTQYRVQDE
ncbi:hypothetical protein [Microvirga arabica]|uniref:hypothetical protein n=1 Tax=Microvirga arabica TaxID=1128671 RepID=UPI001939969B|nr:hypothetical protein [Microvirga arabica]MBM1172335.1 hypothetical protein [Microvirga arabica]